MVVRYYSSTAAETTLTGTINAGATTIVVGSVTGLPGSYPYTLALDYESVSEELVDVTAAAGTSLTVTRAVDGTNATSHSAGARVRHVSSARDYRDSRTHENTAGGVHGTTGAVVGTTDTQTLSNKTIASPVLTGTVSGNVTISGQTTWSGTTAIRINNAPTATPTSTTHSFQIGATATENIRMDGNEILAVNNGVASALALQEEGGSLEVFGGLATDNTSNFVDIKGTVESNTFQVGRVSGTATAFSSQLDADSAPRVAIRADGLLAWGAGSGSADTNLYRSAANTLRTDDSLSVAGTITQGGLPVAKTVTGSTNISFTTETLWTQTISFGQTFPSPPRVMTNIASPSGTTARWSSRSYNVTTTGFTLFLYSGLGDPAQTWSSVPVTWVASI